MTSPRPTGTAYAHYLDRAATSAARDRMRAAYAGAIGRPRTDLATPALLLDLPAARRNIALMAERIAHLPAGIRPHIKVHKSPELARMQVDAGALGVSTATVWEAVEMAAAGLDDILVANTVVGSAKIDVLVQLAASRRILVAVDDITNARALSAAAHAAGTKLGVLIEVDTGMDRAGVDDPDEAIELARELADMPGLELEGLTGYEGHCSLTPDYAERARKQKKAMATLVETADRLIDDGIGIRILSAGGTATWEMAASNPRITEIQAGSYVVMDNFHGRMVPEFEKALTVSTTVVSRRKDRVIVDAGSKSIGAPDLVSVVGYDLRVLRFDEEHGIFVAEGLEPLGVGDVVELVPGYGPSTVNLFDVYHVVEDGVVVDIWPISPRGPGHGGLLS